MISKEIIFLLKNLLLLCCIIFGLFFLSESAVGQVTSISQLSDVKPGHWSFRALQSLVERYGCEQGYQDHAFRGDRAISRYELAGVLNACLDRANELIAASSADSYLDEESQEKLQEVPNLLNRELRHQQSRLEQLENKLKLLQQSGQF